MEAILHICYDWFTRASKEEFEALAQGDMQPSREGFFTFFKEYFEMSRHRDGICIA